MVVLKKKGKGESELTSLGRCRDQNRAELFWEIENIDDQALGKMKFCQQSTVRRQNNSDIGLISTSHSLPKEQVSTQINSLLTRTVIFLESESSECETC